MPDDEGEHSALTGPQAPGGIRPGAGTAVLESERRDLEEQLQKRRRASRRHTLWAVLGVSPGAIVPLLAVASEFGITVVAALSFFVAAVEAWRAVQARADAQEIEEKLRQVSSALELSD